MNPIEIPVFGAIGVVAFVLCVSRVLLASSEHGSAIAAIAIAIVILAAASIYAVAPKSGRTLIAVICLLAGIGVIAGGVIGAAEGSRTYEKHETDTTSSHPDRRQPEAPPSSEPQQSTQSEAN